MSHHPLFSALALATTTLAAPAFAQQTAPLATETGTVVEQKIPRIDVGLGGGINNPAGIYGVEANFRIIDHVSVGVAAGNGAWGLRLSPLARVYPFGASKLGAFVEGGLSLNLGSSIKTTVNGQVVSQVDQLLTPVVDAAVGWRFQISKYGWIALRAGYGIKLGGDNNYRVAVGPEQLDSITQFAVNVSQPGGLMAGLAGGVTFL
jgi:hypothetical protein